MRLNCFVSNITIIRFSTPAITTKKSITDAIGTLTWVSTLCSPTGIGYIIISELHLSQPVLHLLIALRGILGIIFRKDKLIHYPAVLKIDYAARMKGNIGIMSNKKDCRSFFVYLLDYLNHFLIL